MYLTNHPSSSPLITAIDNLQSTLTFYQDQVHSIRQTRHIHKSTLTLLENTLNTLQEGFNHTSEMITLLSSETRSTQEDRDLKTLITCQIEELQSQVLAAACELYSSFAEV